MTNYRTLRDKAQKEPGIFELKKGPNGRNLCRFCHTEVTPPRRTFCSPECVHEWNIRNDIRYARRCVLKRDKKNGKVICAECGLDCTSLSRELMKLPKEERFKKAAELKIPKSRIYKSLFDIDHITPVWKGGDISHPNLLENLWILCIFCHQKKTAREAKERAILRKRNFIK